MSCCLTEDFTGLYQASPQNFQKAWTIVTSLFLICLDCFCGLPSVYNKSYSRSRCSKFHSYTTLVDVRGEINKDNVNCLVRFLWGGFVLIRQLDSFPHRETLSSQQLSRGRYVSALPKFPPAERKAYVRNQFSLITMQSIISNRELYTFTDIQTIIDWQHWLVWTHRHTHTLLWPTLILSGLQLTRFASTVTSQLEFGPRQRRYTTVHPHPPDPMSC